MHYLLVENVWNQSFIITTMFNELTNGNIPWNKIFKNIVLMMRKASFEGHSEFGA